MSQDQTPFRPSPPRFAVVKAVPYYDWRDAYRGDTLHTLGVYYTEAWARRVAAGLYDRLGPWEDSTFWVADATDTHRRAIPSPAARAIPLDDDLIPF